MAEELAEELETLKSIYGQETLRSTEEPGIYVFKIPSSEVLPTLRISFPSTYPEEQPEILGTQTSTGEKGQGTRILQLARDVLAQVYVPGAVVLFDLSEELGKLVSEGCEQQEHAGSERESSEAYLHHHGAEGSTEQVQKHNDEQELERTPKGATIAPQHTSVCLHRAGHNEQSAGAGAMYQCILYFHHIYSKNKIKHLHELSQTFNLTGIMKTTRPGFLYAQTLPGLEEEKGTSSAKESLEAFVKEVKQMRWQEVHLKSLGQVKDESNGSEGKAMAEPELKKRPGFEQVEKMSELGSWMHERQLGDILKEGVGR